VSSRTTNATNDIGCEVALLGTVILAVSNIATVLANLVFVITKGAIKSGEFTELVALVIVLTFGSRRRL
jgi:hypothetical protein